MSLIGLLAAALIVIGAIRVLVWVVFRMLGNPDE